MNNTANNDSHKYTSDLEAIMAIRDHAMQEREQTKDPDIIEQWDTTVTTLNLIIRLIDTTAGEYETLLCVINYANQATKAYTKYTGKDDKEHKRLYVEALTFHQAILLLKDMRIVRMIKEMWNGEGQG